MADSNLKRDQPQHFHDNDPFAELTRIMARDSRSEADEARADDAFGIDLEKEMLGDIEDPFGDYDAEANIAAEAHVAYEPAVSHAPASRLAPASPQEDDLVAEAFDDVAESDLAASAWQQDESASYAAPAHSAGGSDGWEREPVFAGTPPAQAAAVDHALADVDMDFGDLDFAEDDAPAEFVEAEQYGHAAAAQPVSYSHERIAQEPAEISLEDELGMLLSDREPEASEGDYRYADAAPAEAAGDLPHMHLYGRGNFAAPHMADAAAPAAYEAAPQEDDRWAAEQAWEDQPAATDDWEAPVATVEDDGAEEEVMVAEPEALEQPAADPFAVFASIAPMAQQRPVSPAPRFDPVEELDTVEVPEAAQALQDDLDLPEPPVEEDVPTLAYDDFDTEFANAFGEMNPPSTPAQDAGADADESAAKQADDDFFAEALGFGAAAAAGTAAAASRPASSWQNAQQDYPPYSDGPDRADLEREIDVASYGSVAPAPRARNRTALYAGVGALALVVLGGIGVYAFSSGGGGDAAPVLVQADTEPLKVKPENPGGATVPNQESRAYDRVAGNTGDRPAAQERLVSTTEEPVDLAARTEPEDVLPGIDEDISAMDAVGGDARVKSEDRIDTAAQEVAGVGVNEDLAAVQPRRVRTMIVRPDGTLVPREEPAAPTAAEPAAQQPMAAIVAEPAATVIREVVAGQQPAQPAAPILAPAAQPATAVEPVVPQQRPAEQPRQQQIAQAPAAAVRTEPAVPQPQAATGEWSMQIASAPSAEGAQATYQDLARRYGNVIGSQGVNIVRADIPGKGTYYRVRIPSASRAEAISLCEKYKGAGGSCFVSK